MQIAILQLNNIIMANTGFADYLKQIWKFLGIFLNYIGQIFQKVKIHFQSPKLKLEDNGKQHFRRPFSEIPGPKGLPLVGNILEFNKAGGAEKFNHFAEKLHKKYGDIFKYKDFFKYRLLKYLKIMVFVIYILKFCFQGSTRTTKPSFYIESKFLQRSNKTGKFVAQDL